MKTWKATVEIISLVGRETKEVKVEARTESSARMKVVRQMGNRDYEIIEIKGV